MIAVAIPIAGQAPVVLETNPPPMAAPRTLVGTFGTARAAYDKFKDATYCNSETISLKIGNSGWGHLNAGFISKGNGIAKPDSITLHVFTAAKDRSYVDKPDVIVLADGITVFSGKAKITDARTNGSEVYTSLEIAISLENFQKIVKADRFGIAVGPTEWILPKSELSKFSDLLGLFLH
jgi:hypothetical protein